MANKIYDEIYIRNIANAIREINGTTDSYLVSEMADAIREIETGIAVVDSGTCGDNITWKLYSNGELIISGTGAMDDYDSLTPFSREDITSVVIEDGVTSIGDYTFFGCTSLTSIIIPNGVTSIGKQAFTYCSNLTNIMIPDSVVSIGDYIFMNCVNLDNVIIGSGLTTISNHAFYYCNNLKTIIIPESIISIGTNAFYATSLTNIFYTGTKLQWDALSALNSTSFANAILCCKYEESLVPEEPLVPVDSGTCGDNITWKLYSNGELIISGTGAMDDYDSLTPFSREDITSVVIEDGVTSIGESAFDGCTNLTSITIGDSVTTIGNYAFYDCTNLTSITIPDSVTTIGEYAFCGCTSLTNITIPDSVTTIGYAAFSYCENLTSVTIPDSVTTIGDYTFLSCHSLTTINVPWAEGTVAGAPWGATNATINYNYQGGA